MSEYIQEKETVVRPYIIFRRTLNKGLKPRIAKKTGEVTQQGEYQEDWRCELTDSKGELATWATVAGMQYYVGKGYQPTHLGDFEAYLARKDKSQEMIQELTALYQVFSRNVREGAELSSAVQEIDALKARIAELEAVSGSEGSQDELNAKLEAEAKARADAEAANQKLLEELEQVKAVVAEQKKAVKAEAKAKDSVK